MAVRNDTLDELERRRLELEENVGKLRQSLYNWRLWEAEYDGLKDELKTLNQDCTSAEIFQVGVDFEGTVVDEKEVNILIGEGQGVTRSRDQVVQQISRRLDYVKQNVASIEKRLGMIQADLDRLFSVERPGPNAATEEYAVTEIFEELDDNGEVISSRISKPGDREPEIVDMLQKASVEIAQASGSEKLPGSNGQMNRKEEDKADKIGLVQGTRIVETTQSAIYESNKKPEELASVGTTITTNAEANVELSDDSDSESPISEVDESQEDTKLRREMLEYGFHEVGKVVAELEMDEEGSDLSYDDDDDNYIEEDDYEDEDEDEYGRTTGTVLTGEYHQQMKELEERLKAGGFINLGPKNISPEEKDSAEETLPNSVLKVTSIEKDAGEEKKKTRKKVAFAEELDIAPESTTPAVPEKTERKIDVLKSDVTPLSESVVERSTREPGTLTNKDTTKTIPEKKRASRFKAARSDGTPTPGDSSTPGIGTIQQPSVLKKSDQPPTPSTISLFPAKPSEPKPFSQPIITGDIFSTTTGAQSRPKDPQPPEGKVTAETLIERPVVDNDHVLPPDPDEIDEEIHRKEVASEFYRQRNLKIQRNGGFLKNDEDEDEEGPLYELDENDQPKRRVSKFKAARIRP